MLELVYFFKITNLKPNNDSDNCVFTFKWSKTTNFLNQENKIQNVNLHNETVEKFQDAQKSKLKHFIFNLDDM